MKHNVMKHGASETMPNKFDDLEFLPMLDVLPEEGMAERPRNGDTLSLEKDDCTDALVGRTAPAGYVTLTDEELMNTRSGCSLPALPLKEGN